MPTRDDFRNSLVAFAKRAASLKEHCKSEEGAKMFLVLPFIAVLGYDDRNPLEVTPEHEADFSEKYKNRVDYAINREGVPVIAVECKSIGIARKDDRGQLKRYYNAVKTIKLGVLTDGIRYEFFVESSEPNMMDDDPFLTIDLDAVDGGQLSDATIDHLYSLTKENFDPNVIADNARLGIAYKAFLDFLTDQFQSPNEDFTRFLLNAVNIKNVRKPAIDTYRTILKSAFTDVFRSHLLSRLDIGDVPKSKSTAQVEEVASISPTHLSTDRVVTTDTELATYEEIRRRLAFLSAGDAELFGKISQVSYKDYKGTFIVFYEKERKGRLMDVVEGKDGEIRYMIADGLPDAEATDLSLFDERLIALLRRRIIEI